MAGETGHIVQLKAEQIVAFRETEITLRIPVVIETKDTKPNLQHQTNPDFEDICNRWQSYCPEFGITDHAGTSNGAKEVIINKLEGVIYSRWTTGNLYRVFQEFGITDKYKLSYVEVDKSFFENRSDTTMTGTVKLHFEISDERVEPRKS